MTAFNVYDGDGTQTQFPITFDYFNVSEIEVLLWDSAVSKWLQKTNTVDYNIASTNINFVAAPAAPTSGITGNVLILRKTEVGTTTLTDAQAVYSPGSAIKAADLNKNQIQALRAVLDLRDSNMPIHGKTWADSSQETRLYSDLNMTGRDVKNVGKLKVETLAFTEGGVEVETDTKDIPTQAELALKDDITNVDSKLAFKDDISSVDAKLALNVTNEDTKLLLKDDVTSVNNKLALNVTNEDAKLALKDDITSVDAKLASNVSNEDAKLALKDDISSVNAKLALNVTNEDTKLAAKADLVAGKVPVSQIPEIAGAEYKGEVANQGLMLAVTGGIGDWVIRNDDSKVYVITGSDPSLASSWTALSYPAGFSGVYNDLTGKPTIPTIDPDTVIDANYVATQQNFTNADRTKLDGIDVGAEVNAVNSVNGSTGNVTIDLSVKADLIGGKLNTTQLPDIAISEYKGNVANQTAMLAITGEKGDWVIRNDDSKVYVITGTSPGNASSWTALSYPAGFSGVYNDLTGKPTLGTAAATNTTDYATAIQGSKADLAVQPPDLSIVAYSGDYTDLVNKPNLAAKADLVLGELDITQLPDLAVTKFCGVVASQSAMLNLAVPGLGGGGLGFIPEYGDWCSRSDNDKVYIVTGPDATLASSWTALTYPDAPVTSVAGRTGVVTLSTSDISGLGTAATTATTDYATAAQGTLADSATQPGDLSTVATSGSYNDLSNQPLTPWTTATGGINYASGKVGIGTSSPNYDLHVHDPSGSSTIQFTNGTVGNTAADGARITGSTSGILYLENLENAATVFTTNNTERMRIDSSGNVGIGTTSPQNVLAIASSGANPAYLHSVNGSSGTGSTDGVVIGMGDATNVYYWNYEAGAQIFATSATERMRIDSSGNVGIGTASFTAPASGRTILEVNGASGALLNLDVGGTRKAYFFTDGTDVYSLNNANGSYILGTNNSERMRIDSSGNVGIGLSTSLAGLCVNNTIRSQNSSSNISYVGFASYTGTSTVGSMFSYMGGDGRSTGYLNFSTADTERMRIDSSGKVGIGTSSPDCRFHVVGNTGDSVPARISNNATLCTIGFETSTAANSYNVRCGNSGGNNFVIYTNNAERMRIDSSGRIGINTSSPAATLSVDALAGNSTVCFLKSPTVNAYLQLGNSANDQGYVGYQSSDMTFYTAGSERMRIDSSGRLGLGVVPTAYGGNSLEIHSASSVNSFLALTNSTTGTGATNGFNIIMSNSEARLFNREAGDISFWTNSTERMRIDSSGNCVLQHTGKYILRENALTAWSMYTNGANGSLIFKDEYNASERLRIDNLGNVGIGTTSVSSSRKVEIVQPASYNSALRIKAAGNGSDANIEWFTGLSQFAIGATQGTDALKFERDGSEKMRIDSAGRLGVGSTDPSADGNIWANQAVVKGTSHTGITIISPSDKYSSLYFGDNDSGDTHRHYKGYIDYNHATDQMQLGSNHTGRVQLTGAGQINLINCLGVNFSGVSDSAVATVLDDYEEGYWTPQINSGISVSSFGMLAGRYTKIGNIVTVDFYINFGTASATGANLQIGGLPYNLSNTSYGSPSIDYTRGGGTTSWQNVTSGLIHFYGAANTNTFGCYKDGGTTIALSSGTSVAGLYFIGSFIYHTT